MIFPRKFWVLVGLRSAIAILRLLEAVFASLGLVHWATECAFLRAELQVWQLAFWGALGIQLNPIVFEFESDTETEEEHVFPSDTSSDEAAGIWPEPMYGPWPAWMYYHSSDEESCGT